MELQFSSPSYDSPSFSSFYDIKHDFPASERTKMDPYDARTAFVAPSTLPILNGDDGLFAKRDIPAHKLIVTYGGLKVVENSVVKENMTQEQA